MKKRVLVWFRGDLRTIDHEPLHFACDNSAVAAVYCFDPVQFGKTSFGFLSTGGHRARFLIEAVSDLRKRLRELGCELIVRVERPESAIGALIDSLQIDTVAAYREVGCREERQSDRLEQSCRQSGVTMHWCEGTTLLHPDDLPFSLDQLPTQFTRFRHRVENIVRVRDPFDEPTTIGAIDLGDMDLGEIPGVDSLLDGTLIDGHALPPSTLFRGGQSAGWSRLREYVWETDRLQIYKETRNGMLEFNDSSKFSPWLAHGCLSPRSIYQQVHQYELERVKNESTYWLIFELLWRDYFKFNAMKVGAKLFNPEGPRDVALPWKTDWRSFDAWREGRTGFPIIDANMRELIATGYMSNRGRQNVASFLTKNLGVDWRMGAEWFESCLIDYDVSSNYGNWAYSAGVGNDPRGFRPFNVTHQAKTYDPHGAYVRHWCLELANLPVAKIHEPWTLTAQEQSAVKFQLGKSYPNPIVDYFESIEVSRKVYRDGPRSKR